MARSLLACCFVLVTACSGSNGNGSAGTTGAAGDGNGSADSGAGKTDGNTPGQDASASVDASSDSASGDANTSVDGGSGDAGADSGVVTTGCKAPTTNSTSGNTCPSSDLVALKATLITDQLGDAVLATHAPGDHTRLFVVERRGLVRIVDLASEQINPTAFLDLTLLPGSNLIADTAEGEEGLLGLAFAEDYATSGRFWINFISSSGGGRKSVIARYNVSASNPDQADPNSGVTMFELGQPQGNHNGGGLAFGPDGCLYAGFGDGGNRDDTGEGHNPDIGNGQDKATQLGKMLRFDVDHPTTNAPGNMSGTADHIWSMGLRNPWRFSFDRETGDMYIGDVGQGMWEEVDVEPKGVGGRNYGWRTMEGTHCFSPNSACDMTGLTLPVDEYAHANGNKSITGGYVYRGNAIPSLKGHYIYADYGTDNVWAFVWNGTGRCGSRPPNPPSLLTLNPQGVFTIHGITSFGEDADGELYIVTLNGKLYRIDRAN